MNAPERPPRGPEPVADVLRRVLKPHETTLRRMAAEEMDRGEFSPGLSRCLDLLDSDQTHADRVAPEETANPGPSCRVSSSPGRTGAQP